MLSDQVAATIANLMRVELSYQLQKELLNKNLLPERFANSHSIPPETINSILQGEKVTFCDMEVCCLALGISLDSLKTVPRQEANYRTMRTKLLSTARKTEDFYQFALERYPYLHTELSENEYKRNIAWIDYEAKQKKDVLIKLKRQAMMIWSRFEGNRHSTVPTFSRRTKPVDSEKLTHKLDEAEKKK